jgi:hypothetical protein
VSALADLPNFFKDAVAVDLAAPTNGLSSPCNIEQVNDKVNPMESNRESFRIMLKPLLRMRGWTGLAPVWKPDSRRSNRTLEKSKLCAAGQFPPKKR